MTESTTDTTAEVEEHHSDSRIDRVNEAMATLKSTGDSGASWFYWIAGLSLINSISAFTGGGWGFIVGLGVTHLVTGMASSTAVALAINIFIAGSFIALGIFANRAQLWAFIVGMVLYGLDGLLYAKVGSWLAAGFHVFVLICLFNGFRAARQLRMAV